MKYTGKVLFAILFAATSVLAVEHDNNIIYKDGENLKIQSKIGVDVQLTGENTEFKVSDMDSSESVFSIGKNGTGLSRLTLDGETASNLVASMIAAHVDPTISERLRIIENAIEKLNNDVEELKPLKQFSVDYSIFKSITDSRLSYLYNDLGHTVIDNAGLDTNVMDKCFSGVIRDMIVVDNLGGLLSFSAGSVMKIDAGKDPAVRDNWIEVIRPSQTYREGTGYDGQPVYSAKYARDFEYNKYENRFYIMFNGGGISYCSGDNLTVWTKTTFANGILKGGITKESVNVYHAAVGVDGTMVATTEFGPVYKLKGETEWKAINLPEHAETKAIRCVTAGNSFLKKADAARLIARNDTLIEVKQTRDLGLSRDADDSSISDYLLPSASRFVLGSTDDEGIWYSNPFDVTQGWTHVTKTVDGAPKSMATGFRQIVFHNGTYVAGVYTETGHAEGKPKGVYFSVNGVDWNLVPGTETYDNLYEPTYTLGTFIIPFNWGTIINGKPAGAIISANPAQGFKVVENGCGYGACETEFGTFIFGNGGLFNIKKSARLVSPVIYSKNEIDEMIKNINVVPFGSLQPVE